MKTPTKILIEAKKLIEDPKNWCQGSLAKTIHGDYVSEIHPEACQYCSVGAVYKVAGEQAALYGTNKALTDTWSILGQACYDINGTHSIANFNVNNSHGRVMRMFDLAIEKSKVSK